VCWELGVKSKSFDDSKKFLHFYMVWPLTGIPLVNGMISISLRGRKSEKFSGKFQGAEYF